MIFLVFFYYFNVLVSNKSEKNIHFNIFYNKKLVGVAN